MAKQNNRRVQMTKMLLKNALVDLLSQKKINEITIKEICGAADVSHSTFYLHYRDQYDLLEDIENEVMANVVGKLKKLSISDDAIGYIVTFLDYIKDNSKVFTVLLLQEENRSFQNRIIAIVENKVKTGVFKEYHIKYPDYLGAFIMYGSIDILRQWIENKFDIPSEKLAKIIYDLDYGALNAAERY